MPKRWGSCCARIGPVPFSANELSELLAALREDVLSKAQAQRLAALLRDSRDARRTYIHYMSVVANLVQGVGAEKGSGPICPSGPKGAAHKLDLTPFSARRMSCFIARRPLPFPPPFLGQQSAISIFSFSGAPRFRTGSRYC